MIATRWLRPLLLLGAFVIAGCATQRTGLRSDVEVPTVGAQWLSGHTVHLVVKDERTNREKSREVVDLVAGIFEQALNRGGVEVDESAGETLEVTISAYESSFHGTQWTACAGLGARLANGETTVRTANGHHCESGHNWLGGSTADGLLRDALEQTVKQVGARLNDNAMMTAVAGGPETVQAPATAPAPINNIAVSTPAAAPDARRALVIGASAYSFGRLRNPVNDARAVAEALRSLRFQVDLVVDPDQATMKRSIDAFGAKLSVGGVALFYYAGHGMQVDGRNYLIPIGAKIHRQTDVDIEAIDVARVLSKMDGASTSINLVILDACRNNPFSSSFRSINRGLAFVQAPNGTLIAYATAPGEEAQDGKTGHSPYTGALVKQLRVEGAPVEEMFKAVRREVQSSTAGKQTPWESSSLTQTFEFAPQGKQVVATRSLAGAIQAEDGKHRSFKPAPMASGQPPTPTKPSAPVTPAKQPAGALPAAAKPSTTSNALRPSRDEDIE